MPFNFPNNPTVGQISTQNERRYAWNGNVWNLLPSNLSVDLLVVGGGGAGGGGDGTINQRQGGGGGGGALIEQAISITLGTAYTISIGAGGACSSANATRSGLGNPSRFGTIYASGGGSGGMNNGNGTFAPITRPGLPGACGGGVGVGASPGTLIYGTVGPGFQGGSCSSGGGGGGGMGAVGGNSSGNSGGAGGAGAQSSITGLMYCGGGGGFTNNSTVVANGGSSVGGNGANTTSAATAGAANRGSGGGGCNTDSNGNGGSGVVVLRYVDGLTPTIGAGLTYSSSSSGGLTTLTITAGTDTITFN